MSNPGGPAQLTPQLLESLREAVSTSNFIAPACRSVGLNPTTFYTWTKRGKAEHQHLQDLNAIPHADELQYLNFYYEIEKAKAEAEVHLVEIWRKQAKDSWQAARDLLARRYPERWGATAKLKINLPEEDLDTAIEKELARLASGGEIVPKPQEVLQVQSGETAEGVQRGATAHEGSHSSCV